jgi:putative nucleotidyltransferase with HDIG domain
LLLTDRHDHSRQLARELSLVGRCKVVPLDRATDVSDHHRMIVSDVSLSSPTTIALLRKALSRLRAKQVPLLCLVRQRTHLQQSQAFALGATEFLAVGTPRIHLLAKIAELLDASQGGVRPVEEQAAPVTRQAALRAGIIVADMLEAAGAGKPLSPSRISKGSEIILAALEAEGLRAWLEIVWRHDDRTYQHCLLVAGLAAAFSMKLGFGASDRRLLTEAALLHDVGKSRIPLDVLNKPDKLTDQEMGLMRTHAPIGYDLLAGQGGFNAQVLDVVRHHHEYLDSSGYPDGLAAGQISDLVRLTTICDIYAALLEKRSYKGSIAPDAAYEILLGMNDKLDHSLVRAFRPVTESAARSETMVRKTVTEARVARLASA